MKPKRRWLVLSSVLLFYAALYTATSKKCDGTCEKMDRINRRLVTDPAIYGTYPCRTDFLCVAADDSVSRNWAAVVDTACLYLNNEGLHNYTVAILGGANRDTLAKQRCP